MLGDWLLRFPVSSHLGVRSVGYCQGSDFFVSGGGLDGVYLFFKKITK